MTVGFSTVEIPHNSIVAKKERPGIIIMILLASFSNANAVDCTQIRTQNLCIERQASEPTALN